MQHRKIKLTPALRSYLDNKGVSLPGRKENRMSSETKIMKKITPVSTVSRRIKINRIHTFPEVEPLKSTVPKKQTLLILIVVAILFIVIYLFVQLT